MIVLYLGPDSLLPLGSILAAVAGFILLFWNRITGVVRRAGHKPDDIDDGTTEAAAERQDPDTLEGR
jgi:hypothetical protein